MYCNKCGKKIPDDSEFCPSCGNKLTNKNSDKTQNEVVDENSDVDVTEKNVNTVDVIAENQAEEKINVSTDVTIPQKRKNKKLAVIVVIIIGIIAVITLAMGRGTKKISVDSRNECNFRNGGQIAYDNDNLFFVGNYNKDDQSTSLYSTSHSGTNKQLLSDNGDILRIKLTKDKIIFSAKDGETNYLLGVMNKDGKEEKEIVSFKSDGTPTCFDIYKNSLYYLSAGKIHKCNLDGTNDTEIVDADTFTLAGNLIYFVSNEVISSYSLSSEKTEELCKSSADYLIVDNETIYFKNDKGLYCVSIKGGVANKITNNDSINNFVIDNERIYFVEELTIDEIKALAKYMENEDNDYTFYALAMIMCGQLKSVNLDGSGGSEEVKTDQLLMTNLYTTPLNYYCKNSVWSTSYEIITFE